MHDVVIMTDSSSGITQEKAAQLGVEVIPIPFLINGETYFEGVNLSQEQFFQYLKEDAEVSTSQPSPGVLTEAWERILKTHQEIVYIPLSSGLSNSCMTALALAQEYDGRVQVVDNGRVSVPQYQTVMDALFYVREGKSAQEIKQELEMKKNRFHIYVTVDTFKYLKKGGRVSGTAAVLGTMLNIKPVLILGVEKLDVTAKCRGMKAAQRTMIEALRKDLDGDLREYFEQGKIRIMTAYSNISQAAVEEWNREVREAFQVDYVESAPLALGLACHIGPGGIGIAASYTDSI